MVYTAVVDMLSASAFALLAGSALTNTVSADDTAAQTLVFYNAHPSQGPTVIRGDIGSYPGAMDAGEPIVSARRTVYTFLVFLAGTVP